MARSSVVALRFHEHAEQVARYAAQARMFMILIDSFIALETRPNQPKAWLF
jgi:hypothetical protein